MEKDSTKKHLKRRSCNYGAASMNKNRRAQIDKWLYMCEFCDCSNGETSSVMQHMKLCTVGKPFKCESCD